MRIHIAYATREGQTAQIADYIAEVVRAHGHRADTADVGHAKDRVPAGCDAVIVGSSVHMGKHAKQAAEYVRRNRQTLDAVPSAFFSVSLAVHGDEAQADSYVEQFETETGWRPAHVGLGTDTSRDYVYTDWDGVRRFTDSFLASLPSGTPRASRSIPLAGGAPPASGGLGASGHDGQARPREQR